MRRSVSAETLWFLGKPTRIASISAHPLLLGLGRVLEAEAIRLPISTHTA
ncbi:MAG: hypothetical protein AAGH40_04055 [Verrucomicrobiota bacterium]